MDSLLDIIKDKIMTIIQDNVKENQVKTLMERVTPLINEIFEQGKADSKNFPKIQKEFENCKNSYFIGTKTETTTEEIDSKIKEILTKGLMKKTDKNETEMSDIIDKEYSNLIKGNPLKIEAKDTPGKKTGKKRVGTLFKITFTNHKLNVSGDGFYGNQLMFEGIPSYNSGNDNNFIQLSREFPSCSKKHTQKLGEISYKLRKKFKDCKTRITLERAKYRFKIEVKKGGNKWLEITECSEIYKTYKKDLIEANNIEYVPYSNEKVNKK